MGEQPVMASITIGGKEYQIAPLRVKHLKQISTFLEERKLTVSNTFSDLDKWMPFIGEAVKLANSSFDVAELEEMSLIEFSDAWTKVIEVSGLKVTKKSGETQPVSIGPTSTAGSQVQ